MLLLREVELYSNYIFGLKFLILFLGVSSVVHATGSENPVNITTDSFLQKCSSDEMLYNGYCYEIIIHYYTWHKASKYCKKEGGRNLVSLHNNNEERFIHEVYEHGFDKDSRFISWTGLRTDCSNETLYWTDGTPYQFSKIYNDSEYYYHECGNERLCVFILEETWVIYSCDAEFLFICKRSINSAAENNTQVITSHPSYCKPEWHTFRDNCYLPVEKHWVNFEDANNACILLNGTLASIEDADEQVFLSYLMQNLKHDAWIGFYYTANDQEYTWLDNFTVNYMNFAGSHNFSRRRDLCIFMQYSAQERGQWKDAPCYEVLPYICKAKTDPSIKKPSIPLSVNCTQQKDWLKQGFSCFKLFNQGMSWVDADATCKNYSAELISISDIDVQSTFKYLSLDVPSSWIGLSINSNQNFEWINGLPMTTSYWDKNQPVIKEKQNVCFVSSSEGFWHVSSCNATRQFICQITDGKSSPSNTKPNESKICTKKNFLSFKNHNYCYSDIESSTDYDNAIRICEDLGSGNILSIHSRIQVENLKNYLNKSNYQNSSFYIGLSRNKKGGFVWADGSPVDFEYWDENEPSNFSECFEMKKITLKWKSTACNSENYVICSVKAEKNPNASTEGTSSLPVVSNQQYSTESTTSEKNPNASIEGTSSLPVVSNQQFSTDSKFTTSVAERTSMNDKITSSSTPNILQSSTETTNSTSEATQPLLTDGTTSSAIEKTSQSSMDIAKTPQILLNDTTTSSTIVKTTQSSTESRQSTHETSRNLFTDPATDEKHVDSSKKNNSRSPLSDGALAGILISIIIIVLALFGTYFNFKHYLRMRLKLGISKETSFQNVFYDVSTGLEIQKMDDEAKLIPAAGLN